MKQWKLQEKNVVLHGQQKEYDNSASAANRISAFCNEKNREITFQGTFLFWDNTKDSTPCCNTGQTEEGGCCVFPFEYTMMKCAESASASAAEHYQEVLQALAKALPFVEFIHINWHLRKNERQATTADSSTISQRLPNDKRPFSTGKPQ
ncbi:hypothetical protein ACROYT_G004753 [Oculina patagonica]